MRVALLIFLISLSIFFTSCDGKKNRIRQENKELICHLKSGSYTLVEENEIEVNGSFENDSLLVEYFSVSPEEYYEAFESVGYLQKHFTRKEKINEDLSQKAYRKNDSLILVGKSKNYILTENVRDEYFYEGIIGNLHIIRAMEFEDLNTYFISTTNGKVIHTKIGSSVATIPEKGLVLYSDNFLNHLRDSTETSLYQVENESLHNLVTIHSSWFASFAFFKNRDELYYLHSFYENNASMKSSYAKMEIRKK
ncbi:MAG: hypothetical protein JXR20_05145 [Balneola sp.]